MPEGGSILDTILELSERILVPDWADLIALVPLGVVGLVLLVMGLLARTWLRFLLEGPERPWVPVRRPEPARPAAAPAAGWRDIRRGLGLVLVGAVVMAVALTVLPARDGGVPLAGPDLVILLGGIVIALAGAASAIVAYDRADRSADARLAGEAPAPGPRSARRPITPVGILRAVARVLGRVPRPARPLPGVSSPGSPSPSPRASPSSGPGSVVSATERGSSPPRPAPPCPPHSCRRR